MKRKGGEKLHISEILNRLNGVKRVNSKSYQAKCPCHNDRLASLSITEKGDKILMHCFAGCDTRDITERIGISTRDLCGNIEVEKERGWKEKIKGLEAVYDYGDYVKIRCEGKVIRYGHIMNGKFISGMPKGIEKRLYRQDNIRKAKESNRYIYITEGEKDCDNMIKRGFYCITAGGINDWKKEYAQFFKGGKVVILPDNDDVGYALAERIARDIKNIAFMVSIVKTSTRDKGDVSDYFADGFTVEALMNEVDSAKKYYADWVTLNNQDKPSKINSGILANSIGKSLTYILLKKKGIDVTDFYVYENGVYEQKSRTEFKGYIKEYVPIAYQTDALLNNVTNLLLASNDNSYDYERANENENIINFKNGLYDIKERRLKKHTPSEITTIQLQCNYNPQAKYERWTGYMNTLCSDDSDSIDKEKINMSQEWFGLLISNVRVSKTKKCLALYSPLGDTGKSKFLDVISLILGENNVAHVSIQNMSDRFAMGNLYGKRLNAIGDQKSTDIEDSSIFKQLTGGDYMAVEMKGKTAFQFRFKGGFAFACNDLPCFKDDKGGHIFDRFTIIKCERYLKPEERDKELLDKLKNEYEGIVLWGLEGLHRLIENGYNFSNCKSSDDAIKEYRGNVDTFYKFVTENYRITMDKADKVKKTEFESKYFKWCEENEYATLKKRNIKERVLKSGIKYGKYRGDWFYMGIKAIEYYIENVDSKNELPF